MELVIMCALHWTLGSSMVYCWAGYPVRLEVATARECEDSGRALTSTLNRSHRGNYTFTYRCKKPGES